MFESSEKVFHLIEITPAPGVRFADGSALLATAKPRFIVAEYYFSSQPGHKLLARGTKEACIAARRLITGERSSFAKDAVLNVSVSR